MANTFKNKGLALSSTDRTDLYTCPANTAAVIHTLNIANVNGVSSASITIEVYDTSATAYYKIGYLIPVPGGSSYFYDKPINLEAGDKVSLTASTANYLEAFASILEIA
jgi:hypothetical protein